MNHINNKAVCGRGKFKVTTLDGAIMQTKGGRADICSNTGKSWVRNKNKLVDSFSHYS